MTEKESPKPINEWDEEDRPRERLIKKGPSSLTNFELLAILLRTGAGKHKTAIDLAKTLLDKFDGDLNKLAELEYGQLKSIKGIGTAKAATLIAAFELGRRRQQKILFPDKPAFCESQQVFNYVFDKLRDNTIEKAILLTLNNKNSLINEHEISYGGQSSTVIDVREIIRRALYDKATGIILIHNHPSDNVSPSSDDIEITKKIKEACKLVDIRFLDHLIIGKSAGKYFSFTDEQLI